MIFWWIIGVLAILNLGSGLFFGKVWHRTRFATPAEPLKFFPGIIMSIFIALFTLSHALDLW